MRARTRNNLLIIALVAAVVYLAYQQDLIPGLSPGGTSGSSHDDEPEGEQDISARDRKHDNKKQQKSGGKKVKNDEPNEEDEAAQGEQEEASHEELVELAIENVFDGVDDAHLHGAIGLREDGSSPYQMKPPLQHETNDEKREHHKGNCFNLRRSDSMPLDRHLDDMRHPKCKAVEYPEDLPIASVIFVFYNEPFSPLFRSVHSVLNRTPPRYLHEIVLVDDCSDADELKQPLDDYIKLLPKVKLVRLKQRSGLMTARTAGARAATGEVAVFLDSHIEVTQGWLEPMLARVGENRHHVVMPIIDSIDADSFTYFRGGIDILGFSWRLGQTPLGRARTEVEPMPSVIMAGGLFAMDRKLFHETGEYDPEMQLYGGEEMEISFRIWQCGMTLECIPCSRVGHIFRSSQYWQGQVYKVPGEVIVRNKLRAAEVWMDEYKEIVFDLMAPAGEFDLGPLEYMRDLRTRMQCKSFKWFLDNVYPELFVPFKEFKIVAKGEIRNQITGACFDTLGSTNIGTQVGAYPCHGQKGTQAFYFTDKNTIRLPTMDFNSCLDRDQNNNMNIWGCQAGNQNQIFIWNRETGQLTDSAARMCVEVTHDSTPKSPFSLKMAECSAKPEQKWKFGTLIE